MKLSPSKTTLNSFVRNQSNTMMKQQDKKLQLSLKNAFLSPRNEFGSMMSPINKSVDFNSTKNVRIAAENLYTNSQTIKNNNLILVTTNETPNQSKGF